MKDLVANLSISCRFDLIDREHEMQEDERGPVSNAMMDRSRSKGEAQHKLPNSILARNCLQSCHFPPRLRYMASALMHSVSFK